MRWEPLLVGNDSAADGGGKGRRHGRAPELGKGELLDFLGDACGFAGAISSRSVGLSISLNTQVDSEEAARAPVSYTHLTLPTSDLV